VQAPSYTWNITGYFSCSNGGETFYANGSLVEQTATTCLYSADWEDENVVQCWAGKNSNNCFTYSVTVSVVVIVVVLVFLELLKIY